MTYTRISPNRTSPRRNKIDSIIIHCIVGQCTAKAGCDYFATTDRQCSANYVVGKDGSIGLSVEEKDRAWCSGGTDKNGNAIRVNGISGADFDHRAVAIEVASDTTEPYAVTDEALAALIRLCADICRRNGIERLLWEGNKSLVGQTSRQNMGVHRWFANKSCPGDYLYDLHPRIAAEVNKLLSGDEEDENVPRYNTMAEIEREASYAAPTVQKLIALGAIRGGGKKDADGNPADMDLSRDMLRVLVMNDRAGAYGE